MLRTIHLAGHYVAEITADPPEVSVQPDDMGAVHLVEAGQAHLLRVTGPGTRWLDAFSRAFARYHGCSPGQWRREH